MRGLIFAILMFATSVIAQEVNTSPTPGAPVRYGGPVTVSVNPGLVALGVKKITVAVPGTRVGDFVRVVPLASSTITLGATLNGEAEVLTDGQVTLTFSTPIVLGVTLGAMNVRVRWSSY